MSFVTIGVTVGSALYASHKAKSANKAQQSGMDQAIEQQGQTKDEALALYKPYVDAGTSSLQKMLGMTGQGGSTFDITQDPSYQFRMDQSNKALETSAASKGGLMSGGFANQALKRAGEFASTEYANIYQRLSGIATLGMNAAGASANVVTNYGANVSNLLTGKGQAQASMYTAQANIAKDMAGGIAGATGGGYGGMTGWGGGRRNPGNTGDFGSGAYGGRALWGDDPYGN